MDSLAEKVARRVVAGPTRNAANWAEKYEAALKKGQTVDDVKVTALDGGNVRTYIQTEVRGKTVPDIVVEETRVNNSYSRIKWVRIDSGPGAKFIDSPTKMAQYVIEKYLGGAD